VLPRERQAATPVDLGAGHARRFRVGSLSRRRRARAHPRLPGRPCALARAARQPPRPPAPARRPSAPSPRCVALGREPRRAPGTGARRRRRRRRRPGRLRRLASAGGGVRRGFRGGSLRGCEAGCGAFSLGPPCLGPPCLRLPRVGLPRVVVLALGSACRVRDIGAGRCGPRICRVADERQPLDGVEAGHRLGRVGQPSRQQRRGGRVVDGGRFQSPADRGGMGVRCNPLLAQDGGGALGEPGNDRPAALLSVAHRRGTDTRQRPALRLAERFPRLDEVGDLVAVAARQLIQRPGRHGRAAQLLHPCRRVAVAAGPETPREPVPRPGELLGRQLEQPVHRRVPWRPSSRHARERLPFSRLPCPGPTRGPRAVRPRSRPRSGTSAPRETYSPASGERRYPGSGADRRAWVAAGR